MPALQLQQLATPLTYTVEETADDPWETYLGWATELGIDSGASVLEPLQDDDNVWIKTMREPFWFDTDCKSLMFSSEAGIGLYRNTPQYADTFGTAINLVNRFYWTRDTPALVLIWHPMGSDLRSYDTRSGKAQDATILFARYSNYGNSGTQRYDAALKIRPGRLEFVGRSVDYNNALLAVEFADPGDAYNGFQTLQETVLYNQTAASRIRLLLTTEAPTAYMLTGVARFTDGAIPELLLILRHASGDLIAQVVPDQDTGHYLWQSYTQETCDLIIYRDGYRPLVHGPVLAVEVT